MNSCPRRTVWSCRGIKLKIQNIPQQLCKACLRVATWLCEADTTRSCCVILTLCLLCCVLFGWILFRDPCFQWSIQKSICEDYRRGLIAGALCYDLCIERTPLLSSCVDQTDQVVTFRYQDVMIKVARLMKGKAEPYRDRSVWEGMTHDELHTTLQTFFTRKLGLNDHSNLIKRLITFADFNKDDTISFGEVNSVWQLLHIPEFHILFTFQGNSVFPMLNGTCGSMYSYKKTYHQVLYDKSQQSVWDTIFPNRFRWHFPSFPKRVHIALGLLEYASLAMEEENTRFHMCDFTPKNFGFSEYYEMKVSKVDGIVSETELNATLTGLTCDKDSDCVYGTLCQTTCNKNTHSCMGVRPNETPDLVKVCEILVDYILTDTPPSMKMTLSRLISQCQRLGKKTYKKLSAEIQVEQNIVFDRIHEVLWDELKNEENKWLYKPTQRPYN